MTAAMIITAGKTSRKSRFEPQKEVGTITTVQRAALVFQRAGVERVVVVCSGDGEKTERLAPNMNLEFLYCPKDAEMLDSVKIGLSYLRSRCSRVLICPVDVPLFSVQTIQTLLAAEGSVCVPSYQGRGGHPILLHTEVFQPILDYTGEGGLAGAIRNAGLKKQFVELDDEGIVANVEQDDGYNHLIDSHDLTRMHPDFRIRLMKERAFYGPGAHQLLQLTTETGSLLEACRKMGISYSKGRKIISDIEQQLGRSVLESQQGGKTGGQSVVTDEGTELMRRYSDFCDEARDCLHKLFEKHFNI